MASFEAYLQDQHLAASTIATYQRSVRRLRAWMRSEGIEPEELSYRDLVAYLRSLTVSPRTKNAMLTALRHWMRWLVHEERRADNPAAGLVVRGERRRLPHDLLSEEQLGELYQSYEATTPARQRNQAMLGLLVYQALTTSELARLVVDDVDVESGLLNVPGHRRSEGRLLWLEGKQVLALHRYLTEARPALLALADKETDLLFVSAGSGERLQNALAILMRELGRRHAFFRSARQLRASRLALWLKTGHLREVQHKAGHRFVSSTERYQAADLDRLLASLSKHHPLR